MGLSRTPRGAAGLRYEGSDGLVANIRDGVAGEAEFGAGGGVGEKVRRWCAWCALV